MTAVIITAVIALAIIGGLFRWLYNQDHEINELRESIKEKKEDNEAIRVDLLECSKRRASSEKLVQNIKLENEKLTNLLERAKKAQELKSERVELYKNELNETQKAIESLKKAKFAQGIEITELKKDKKSLQNQIAVAWKQVKGFKQDEKGNQRTLTGAIDAALDTAEAIINEKQKAIEDLQAACKDFAKQLNAHKPVAVELKAKEQPKQAQGGRTRTKRRK